MFLKKKINQIGRLGMTFALLAPLVTPMNTYASTIRSNTGDTQVNGSVQALVADIVIPSVTPDLVIDPNAPDGALNPEFEIENKGTSPMSRSQVFHLI